MSVEMIEEPKVEEKQKLIDNETFRKLHSGEKKFETLGDAEKKEFHERFVVGGEEVPSAEEEVKTIPEVKIEAKVEKEEIVSEEESERRKRFKAIRDENNTLVQKLAAAQEREERLKKMRIDNVPKLDVDEFDENAKAQQKYNKEVADKVNSFVDDEGKALNRDKQQLQQESLYMSMAQLQEENPELKTSKSIKALDAAYIRFRDTLVPGSDNDAKNAAVQEFLGNPEKRKQAESQGILFPFSDDDWKKYQMVSNVHSYRSQNSFPDLDSAYYKYKKENGIIPDLIKSTAIDTHRKVVEQIADKNNKATILAPNDGVSGPTDGGMTEEQAVAWIMSNQTPSTPAQKKILMAIMEKFSPK